MWTRIEIVAASLLLVLRVGTPAHLPEYLPLRGWWPFMKDGEEFGENTDEYQVVFLPALLPREATSVGANPDVPLAYSFDAFGKSFKLQLLPNRRLVAPGFSTWTERGRHRMDDADVSCHYLHANSSTVAAFSACHDRVLHGLIVAENSTFEVRPLVSAMGRAEKDNADRTAHVIQRVSRPSLVIDDEARPLPRRRQPRNVYNSTNATSYTIEVALFFDYTAYRMFSPYFKYNDANLRDMLLAYINGVQALYSHKSLGRRIQLSVVRLTLHRSQPRDLPAVAERGRLLDTFCAYQRALNVEDDDDSQHWDMALLLSGLDFYAEESGRQNMVTMGLAPVGGVCLPAHACVIAEFGASDTRGRPYPSAGFTSVYIMAHEIGHNLGMHHDGVSNTCARDGYIMSPSRGTRGEATWSPCSASIVADLGWATCLVDGAEEAPPELQHEQFNEAPGVVWGTRGQCQVLLRDEDAAAFPSAVEAAHCEQLVCRSPHRAGFYYAGPALPGTLCGRDMWCQGGDCVPNTSSTTPKPVGSSTENNEAHSGLEESRPGLVDASPGLVGHWGHWREGSCASACTTRGRGVRERHRACLADPCEGLAYDVLLCDDTKICGKKKRVVVTELAGRKCASFAKLISELDPAGGGLQAPHDPTRMWMGCAVFCRRREGGGFYAPRVELNDAGVDPYLPDGTWCHYDGAQHYYCMQHHCLPENFKMTPQSHSWDNVNQDISGSFNARARMDDNEVAPALRAYLSLGPGGEPLPWTIAPPAIPDEPEEDWEVIDYIDLKGRR